MNTIHLLHEPVTVIYFIESVVTPVFCQTFECQKYHRRNMVKYEIISIRHVDLWATRFGIPLTETGYLKFWGRFDKILDLPVIQFGNKNRS